jgi:PTS system N-acetylglucosamine-specific IIC component
LRAGTRGESFVVALGGAGNLTEVTACTTRLRLSLADNRAIDEPALKRLGSRGVLRSSTTGLQVVLGPIADQVAGEIRDAWRSTVPDSTRHEAPQPASHDAAQPAGHDAAQPAGHDAAPAHRDAPQPASHDAPALLAALGGRRNVSGVESFAGRVSLRISDPTAIDERVLSTLGVRGVAHPTAESIQLLVPGSVEEWAQPLRRLLA